MTDIASQWFVAALCRRSDPDRMPKFFRALEALNAKGEIGDLDDGPAQTPLPRDRVEEAVLELLPEREYALIMTHSPTGEYTRHIRHEEVARAVISLWLSGRIRTSRLLLFAYEDGGKRYLPRAIRSADQRRRLSKKVWKEKYRIITRIYGFSGDSYEARTVPKKEAFWCFQTADEYRVWYEKHSPVGT